MAHRQEIQKPQRKKGTRVLAILRPLTANRADVGENVFMSYDDAFWFGCRARSEYDFGGVGGGHGSPDNRVRLTEALQHICQWESNCVDPAGIQVRACDLVAKEDESGLNY